MAGRKKEEKVVAVATEYRNEGKDNMIEIY
jgi:hypothetical protein